MQNLPPKQRSPEHVHGRRNSPDGKFLPLILKPRKERLDALLVARHPRLSLAKAQALIMAGQVLVDGQVVRKAGHLTPLSATLSLVSGPRFVSRGGEKLAGALADLGIDVTGRVCLDVGASTGGFTDCLLQSGAQRVYAVDVGRGQMDARLLKNPRVVLFEATHIRDFAVTLEPPPDFATVDVSFISLRSVLPAVMRSLVPGGEILALFKPQFEVGARNLKKGVVRCDETRLKALQEMIAFAEALGLMLLGEAPSRLKGPKGNQEHFLYLRIPARVSCFL